MPAAGQIDLGSLSATDGRLRQLLEDQSKQFRLEDAQLRLASRNALRPKDSREAGIVRVDPRVEVRYLEDPNTGIVHLEVAIYSLMSPGYFKRVLLDRRTNTVRMIQVAAGACCEALCDEQNDPFDPDRAAKLAGDKWAELNR